MDKNPSRKKILAVVGPTASGKTRLAVELSRRFGGEVVSCDSVQIYKKLDIGSAKPEAEETAGVKYHLLNLFEPDYRIDAGTYKKLAEECITRIHAGGSLPVIAGGTGMYFNSIYYGLFSGPGRSDIVRAGLKEKASREGPASLYEELLIGDPASASKIQINDQRRIIRALEVLYMAGSPISALHRNNKRLDLDWFIIGLDPDRNFLYENIERRIDRMVENGLIEETKTIIDAYGNDACGLSSIGYRHAANYIKGAWDFDEFIYFLKRDTRHYAKRQITWFKKNHEIHWFKPGYEDVFPSVENFLAS